MVKKVVVCDAVFSANAPVVFVFLSVNLFIIAITTLIGSGDSSFCYTSCTGSHDECENIFTLCESARIYVLLAGISCFLIACVVMVSGLVMFCFRREMPNYVPATAPPPSPGITIRTIQQPPVNSSYSVNPSQQLQQPTQGYTNPLGQQAQVSSPFSPSPLQQRQQYQHIPQQHI